MGASWPPKRPTLFPTPPKNKRALAVATALVVVVIAHLYQKFKKGIIKAVVFVNSPSLVTVPIVPATGLNRALPLLSVVPSSIVMLKSLT